jgi:hypothetical protein
VTPQLIADKVRAEAVGLYGQILTRAKDEDLAALIPQEVVERLIKLRAAKPGEDPKPAAELHPALGGPTVRQGDKKPDEERPPPDRGGNQAAAWSPGSPDPGVCPFNGVSR